MNTLVKKENNFLKASRNCETGCYVEELREVEKENEKLRKLLKMAIEDISRGCTNCGNSGTNEYPKKCPVPPHLYAEYGEILCKYKWRGAKESEGILWNHI